MNLLRSILQSLRRRLIIRMTLLGIVFVLISPFALRVYTAWRYQDRIYALDTVPSKPVAVIFGARVLPSGRLSTMLRDRVATGADLYHTGKVDMLLLSGAGTNDIFNEPEAMRRYALRLNVPEEAIILDSAGLRTYDTCYRAKHVFGVETAILVTQDFHLDRALLLCNSLGIEAVGVGADYHRPNGYQGRGSTRSEIREIPATVLAFIDLVRRPTPSLERPESSFGG